MGIRAPVERRRAQRGQAMTEFTIAATYVLVPLFVFVPLLGKYIDFKHASIQNARYQAWEYTVWYDDIDERDILDNFNSGDAGFRMPEKPLAVARVPSQLQVVAPAMYVGWPCAPGSMTTSPVPGASSSTVSRKSPCPGSHCTSRRVSDSAPTSRIPPTFAAARRAGIPSAGTCDRKKMGFENATESALPEAAG